MATFYRLRPGVHQPAFTVGESYRYLRDDGVAGYVWLELDGKPRCVPERDFERSEGEPGGAVLGPCEILRYPK